MVSDTEFANRLIDANLVHSIHTSERLSFRGCRRRWNWIFRELYYPLVTPKPLEFGSAFHKAMETYYNPLTWHDRETAAALAQAVFAKTCKDQYRDYVKKNQGNTNPEAKADYAERTKLGLDMLRYYTKYVSPQYDNNFKPVKVEIEFEVPITDPDGNYVWCKCTRCKAKWRTSQIGIEHHDRWQESLPEDERQVPKSTEIYWEVIWDGLPVTYGGRVDMLAQDELGRYWVFDWKTAARLAGASADDNGYTNDEFMLLDDQISSYCWALRRKLNLNIAGFVYAQIKKAVPEEPEPLKQMRMGRWYSVNKQLATTYEMYYQTVSENHPEGLASGIYDEFLEYLKGPEGPKFHVRHQVHRSETELANIGYYIWLEAMDILSPTLRLYPSPGRFSCSFCAYKEPCIEKNRGEDFEYTLATLFEKRTKAYYEERAPSTDSRGGR
jgi:hypothetical protein